MNRVEIMLATAKNKLSQYPDDRLWVEVYTKQVEFFEWLLEPAQEMPVWEVQQGRVEPTVWGMGDVNYSMHIQLRRNMKSKKPVVLIIDYEDGPHQ